jgi:hypothetical protein
VVFSYLEKGVALFPSEVSTRSLTRCEIKNLRRASPERHAKKKVL